MEIFLEVFLFCSIFLINGYTDYIGNRKVIRLQNAAGRGVDINMILDPNKVAFGHEKTGLPNLPVASEFHKKNKENITIRWYDSDKD